MKLIEITDKNKWNDFVGARAHAEFLQSWEWGEFQEKVEGKVVRFIVEDNEKIIAAGMLIKKSLPLKMNYFYCPRGIVLNEKLKIKNEKLFDFLFAEIKNIAKKEKVIFLRFEPRKFENRKSEIVIRKSIDIQPSKTIMLDLSKSEEVLLATMHQKTRYNIRLAEKKGVNIVEAGKDGFTDFWNLMEKTSGRDGFTSHQKDYYEKLLQTAPEKFKLFTAVYQEKVIAAGIFSFFGDTATYLFGASDNEQRGVMAPYLLQWEIIKKAKAAGCKYYDFFGIDEKKWPGVTRFKHGFSGEEIKYPGTFDMIFNLTSYNLYRILRAIRRFV
jgi:lipid II:glycine glycyltransferase (peptidoglycan interpeptide bridge formation enzyme)